MTSTKLEKAIIKKLKNYYVTPSSIKFEGFDSNSNNIDSVTISLEDYSVGKNVLYDVKTALDDVEIENEIVFKKRLLEF